MNISANATLDLHGFFWTDKIWLSVEGICEIYALLGDMSKTFFMGGIGDAAVFIHRDNFAKSGSERHDLEATGIGEGRAVPARPFRKSTFFGDFV